MKNLIAIIISFALVFDTTFAAIVGTPQSSDANVTCQQNNSTEFFPVGDTNGKSILTKKETIRDCNITITVNGKCLKWKTINEHYSTDPNGYNVYKSNNYGGTLGSLLATLGAYDQLEHIWSGWKGYCEIGTKADFSWAQDPMFWASLAMSMLMNGSQDGGFLEDTSLGESFNAQADSAGHFFTDMSKKAGLDLTKGLSEAATQTLYNNIGRCMIAGGWNAFTAILEDTQDFNSGNQDCDPVDEICDDDNTAANESQIMTMDKVQFEQMKEEFKNAGEDINKYIVILKNDTETGIVTFRVKMLSEVPGVESMDKAEMDKAMEKLKQIKLEIDMAVTAATLAGCVYSATGGFGEYMKGAGSGVSSPDASSRATSVRSLLGPALDFAGKYLGPYGAVISAALKVVMYVLTSFHDIDSCHNESDARECGSRHEKTQKALKFNLCHHVDTKCAQKFFGSCILDGYHYCCYDQLLSKVLVEQLKAELGRDWAHCTGISIRDLNYVSFRQCSEKEMQDGIDGAHQVGDYNPENAFQYKHKCVDMTEFKNYLEAQVGENIDMSDFNDFWNDLQRQSPNAGML